MNMKNKVLFLFIVLFVFFVGIFLFFTKKSNQDLYEKEKQQVEIITKNSEKEIKAEEKKNIKAEEKKETEVEEKKETKEKIEDKKEEKNENKKSLASIATPPSTYSSIVKQLQKENNSHKEEKPNRTVPIKPNKSEEKQGTQRLLEQAVQAKEEYEQKYQELVTNNNSSVSQEDLDALAPLLEKYNSKKQAAQESYRALSAAQQEELKQAHDALTEIALPTVNDQNNNGKVDEQEKQATQTLLEQAAQAKQEYEQKYQELVTNNNSSVSQEDLDVLAPLLEKYNSKKQAAQESYQALSAAQQEELKQAHDALTEIALPTVNDQNNNGKVDSDEAVEVNKDELRRLYQNNVNTKAEERYLFDTNQDKEAFDTAYTHAKEILDLATASKQDVEQAFTRLTQAIQQLNGVLVKRVSFRNAHSYELYHVSNTGEATRTTSLRGNVNPEEYVAVFYNGADKVLLPVAQINAQDNQYEIVLKHNELHRYTGTNYVPNYSFYIEKQQTGTNIFTDFNSLIEAIKQNPRGEYIVGSDLLATEISSDTYIDTFSGTLKSVEGKKYKIFNLKKPLFNTVSNASIENLSFKTVAIQTSNSFGVVAVSANGATFRNLYVESDITFIPRQQTEYIGGLVGSLLNSTVDRVWANVNLHARDRVSGLALGILVGRMSGGTLHQNYAQGSIELTDISAFQRAYTGRIVASATNSSIDKTLVEVTHNPEAEDTADIGFGGRNNPNTNRYYVKETVTDTDRETITKAQALAKLKEWNYLFEHNRSSMGEPNKVSYLELPNYRENHDIAYHNTEKLLPLYDYYTIIQYGNLIAADDILNRQRIQHITWMKDNEFIGDLYQEEGANKLFVQFEDGSKTTYNIRYTGMFKKSGIREYQLDNRLLVTPKQFASVDARMIEEIANEYKTVSIDDAQMQELVQLQAYIQKAASNGIQIKATMQDLYLTDSFQSIIDNIDSHLRSLLFREMLTDAKNPTVQRYIKKHYHEHKEEWLLAWSYINRLFGVQFDSYNIKNIMMYEQNFYQKDFVQTDRLSKLARLGYGNLLLSNNTKAFKEYFQFFKQGNLIDFLRYNRVLFTNQNENEWFKNSSNAFIHEYKPEALNHVSVDLFTRLAEKESTKEYILPLLNVKEDSVYVLSAPATLYFGSYGRYIDQALVNDPSYHQKVLEVQEKLKQYLVDWTGFIHFFYRISNADQQNFLINNSTQIFDGFYILDSIRGIAKPGSEPNANQSKRRWAEKFDENYGAIKDFFGPIGRYYSQSKTEPSAYMNRVTRIMRFDSVDLLSREGSATLSHELVHSYDVPIILNNHDYREGQDTESYALGIFESATTENTYFYGFNFMYHFNHPSAFNHSMNRFQTKQDIQDYVRGIIDSTYLLNAFEAESILRLEKENQRYFFNQVRLDQSEGTKVVEGQTYRHGNDVITSISEQQWNAMNIENIASFIDNNLVNKTSLLKPALTEDKIYPRDNQNNYVYLPMYHPVYAAYQNNEGTVGGLLFRTVVFDLLAEYGWDEGFLPYGSNQLFEQAHREGRALSDAYIFEHIFKGSFSSYAEFKKDMYAKRWEKKNKFREININYNNQTHTIRGYDDLTQLMDAAVRADLQNLKRNIDGFERQKLKEAIVKAWNAITDDFQTSIFKDN